MPYVDVPGATLWVDEIGHGRPLVCLHSGWGRVVMPFDAVVERFGASHRILFPDRRGYGRSTAIDRLELDFHAREAADLARVLAFLEIERPVLWGHSDGAVVAALFAAAHPGAARALVLESIHFHRAKSHDFFERYARDPRSLSEGQQRRLLADHGERWPAVVRMHSQVWLDFHAVGGDFYEGRLGDVREPTLIVHGESDPHTPVEEVEEVARRIPVNDLFVVAGGGHSPHSEPNVAASVCDRVARFLDGLGPD